MAESRPRVMWLLNHTTARKFEVAMLKRLGFGEIFLPKKFPLDIGMRSASVDTSEDKALSIPQEDLELLNGTDWYSDPGRDTWEVVNRHFDLIFFMLSAPLIRSLARHYAGAAILRGWGLPGSHSYGELIRQLTEGVTTVQAMGRRFWLGTAYDHLVGKETSWIRDREVCLPLGLQDCQFRNEWTGSDPKVFFVCPDIEGIDYYKAIYKDFRKHLGELPYAIGGPQALATSDPRALGFVSEEQHRRNMREFRVMFYHGTDPHHVHYHPFEAVRAGMPLVFLAGGLLDRLGGSNLPGRCRNYNEVRAKLARILANDRGLIERIRVKQTVLLDAMQPDQHVTAWDCGLTKVLDELKQSRMRRPVPKPKPRVGIALPVAYRGGTLRSAKLLAEAVWTGSRQAGEAVDVALAYPEEAASFKAEKWDDDLPDCISRRTVAWQLFDAGKSARAMKYAGHAEWEPSAPSYLAMDDGIRHLCDCDFWIIVSDHLQAPLLPMRRYALMVFDYIQRYDAQLLRGADLPFLAAARVAERVLVTTSFTEADAVQYAGVPKSKVFRVPMLVPRFEPVTRPHLPASEPYFLWTTNLAHHKNHWNAMLALREYYETFDGKLRCYVTGVETSSLLTSSLPHLEPLKGLVTQSEELSEHLQILGELPDKTYRAKLAGAHFLWHPARVDNGTLSVIEAASLGVPSLSSRYPAMEEIEQKFGLNLQWMDPGEPENMAFQLKSIEKTADALRAKLPTREGLARFGAEYVAADYWKVIRQCL